jgi:hypothetical protein
MNEVEKEKVNLETAKIPWLELQRFFAKGEAVWISSDLDLVEVGYQFSIDNKIEIQKWLENKQLGLVTDEQALRWLETDVEVWAVVVKPWILVQD